MLKKPYGVVSVSACIIALSAFFTLAAPSPASGSTGKDDTVENLTGLPIIRSQNKPIAETANAGNAMP